MTDTDERSAADIPENARTGYQVAVNLWVYEGTTIWAKFTAMVYANTILLATLGLLITSNRASELALFRIALAGLGLSLCASWIFLTVRSFATYKYWIFSARELENYLSPVQTVSRGGSFADGKRVTFTTTPAKELQLGTLARWRIEGLSYFIIVVFALVYVLTLWQQ
jgi:hypothetical protein